MAEPIARDTLLADIKQDEAKGAAVHTFNPNSSPAEKAASAGKAQSALKSTSNGNGANGARGTSQHLHIKRRISLFVRAEVKLNTGSGPPVQPTITVDDFDEVNKQEEPSPTSPASPEDVDEQPIPGAMTNGTVPAIPDWYRVGWRAVSGFDRPLAEGEEQERNIVAMFINDMYYGQWYHNAGVIFFVSSPRVSTGLFHAY